MEYFYLDNNNKKIKLNYRQEKDFNKLKTDNTHLNSVFSKVDINNDGKLQDNELDLLDKLFKKADSLDPATANNGILENEELQKINEQIENGEIKLPAKQNTGESRLWLEQHWVQIPLLNSPKDEALYKENPEKFVQQQVDKQIKQLEKNFPSSEYEITAEKHGTGFHFNIYPKENTAPKILTQKTNIIRADGIEIQLSDYLKDEVKNDDNETKLNYQAANFGKFTITDKNGKTHELSFNLEDCIDRDAIDSRRTREEVAKFLAELPEDIITQLIENNIKEIYFESGNDITEEEYMPEIYQKIKNDIDTKGYHMEITNFMNMASFISPKFGVPHREYPQEITLDREDGYKFQINDTSETSSILNVTTPSGETFNINVSSSCDTNKYHQWQLPKLKQILSALPQDVLKDLQNEIDSIQFMDKWNIGGNGIYGLGSNTIAIKGDSDDDTPIISFVHELGHSVDNHSNTTHSSIPEFKKKFEEFTNLLEKLGISGNHATDNAAEILASFYAFEAMPDDESLNNHIARLGNKIKDLKNSDKPDEKLCYEKFQELRNDAKSIVEYIRKQPKSVRYDNTVKELVRKECKDIIDEMDGYYEVSKLIGQSTLLELTQTLSLNDEDFEKAIKFYEEMSTEGTKGAPLWKEVRDLYAKIAVRMRELRPRVKQ